jgi:hypothetical protein
MGGDLGCARLGFYEFDKMYNEAAAYTNGDYIIYYPSDNYGWQWVQGYDQVAVIGPQLAPVPTAQDFVKYLEYKICCFVSTNPDPNPTYPSFEVAAQIGGNPNPTADARIGFYQFYKLYNGVAAYNNGHYFIYYFGDNYGWQWTPADGRWAGNGPQLDSVPTAQDFVEHSQFSLATDDVLTYPSFEVTAQMAASLIHLSGYDARLGVYEFDKMGNGVPAYTNDNYFIFYGGDTDGWQWVTGYSLWGGYGPLLASVPTAQDFVEHMQFSL